MPSGFERVSMGEGIHISKITDGRFKTNRVSVNFILPLEASKAAANAIVPGILRKGSQDYPDFRRLNQKLGELYGAFLDIDVRKLGALQVLCFSIRVIDNQYALAGEDLLFDGAKLLCDLILKPLMKDGLFSQENFLVEKQVLIDDINSKINDKRSYAISRCEEILFQGSPMAVDELGDLASAQSLTNQDAVAAYRDILDRAHVEVMITGSHYSQQAADYLAQCFSSLGRHPFSFENQEGGLASQVPLTVEEMDVKQAKMVLGFSAQVQGEEELSAFRLFTALYGGTPVSKLFLNVREKLSLCYYCVSRYDRFKKVMLVDCGVEEGNIEKAREEILRQLSAVQQGDFTDEELEAARMSLQNSFTSLTDSLGGMENWYLNQICSGSANSPQMEAGKLSGVTAQQVRQAASQVKLETVYQLVPKHNGKGETD